MKKNYGSYIRSLYQGDNFGVQTPELRQIISPLRSLVLKIKTRMISGQYAFMIGDDASGRIPALILNKIQNMSFTEKTPLFFLAGSRKTQTIEAKKADIKEFVEEQLPPVPQGKSVLIITEYIHRGDSLVLLTDVLRSLGISYDVCTIGVYSKGIDLLDKKLGTSILFGIKGKPSIDGNYVLAGVEKSYEDLFATRYKMTPSERRVFFEGRRDVTRISEALYKLLI